MKFIFYSNLNVHIIPLGIAIFSPIIRHLQYKTKHTKINIIVNAADIWRNILILKMTQERNCEENEVTVIAVLLSRVEKYCTTVKRRTKFRDICG